MLMQKNLIFDDERIYSIVKQIIRIPIHLKPQAKNNQFIGIVNERLKIAITAPAIDGKANKALVVFLAKTLEIKQQDVNITHGLTHHFKMIELPITAQIKLDQLLDEKYS